MCGQEMYRSIPEINESAFYFLHTDVLQSIDCDFSGSYRVYLNGNLFQLPNISHSNTTQKLILQSYWLECRSATCYALTPTGWFRKVAQYVSCYTWILQTIVINLEYPCISERKNRFLQPVNMPFSSSYYLDGFSLHTQIINILRILFDIYISMKAVYKLPFLPNYSNKVLYFFKYWFWTWNLV